MASPDIPNSLRQFIFEHVDSLAQLEVIFLMREKPNTWFKSGELSAELRTSETSARAHLARWQHIGLLEQEGEDYRYHARTPDLDGLLRQLQEFYKLKPHAVLELIFSSVKRARLFADAFSLSKPQKPDGDSNG